MTSNHRRFRRAEGSYMYTSSAGQAMLIVLGVMLVLVLLPLVLYAATSGTVSTVIQNQNTRAASEAITAGVTDYQNLTLQDPNVVFNFNEQDNYRYSGQSGTCTPVPLGTGQAQVTCPSGALDPPNFFNYPAGSGPAPAAAAASFSVTQRGASSRAAKPAVPICNPSFCHGGGCFPHCGTTTTGHPTTTTGHPTTTTTAPPTPWKCTQPYTQVNPKNGYVINWAPVSGTAMPECEHFTVAVNVISNGTVNPATGMAVQEAQVTVTSEAGPAMPGTNPKVIEHAVTQTIKREIPSMGLALQTNYNVANPTHSTLINYTNTLLSLASGLQSMGLNLTSLLPAIPGASGGLSGLKPAMVATLLKLACFHYVGQKWSIMGFNFTGPIPGCPADALQGGWSWTGGLPSPLDPATWSVGFPVPGSNQSAFGQYFLAMQDQINGNIRSNDTFYACGFPPQNVVNFVKLGVNLLTQNWSSLIIDGIMAGVIYYGTNGYTAENASVNGAVTADGGGTPGSQTASYTTLPTDALSAVTNLLGSGYSWIANVVKGATGFPSCPSTSPNFSQTPTLAHSVQPLPTPNPQIPSLAKSDGCYYTGPTVIQLHQNGTFTAWSPDSNGANAPRSGCPTTGQTTGLPPNGVIYVANLPASASPQNFPNPPFNATNYGYNSSQCNPIQTPIQYQSWQTNLPGPCWFGNAIVQGNLNGQLTIEAQNDVVITNSIYYAGSNCPGVGSAAVPSSNCKTLLALVAEGNVEINHPQNANLNEATTILGYIGTACNALSATLSAIAAVAAVFTVGISLGVIPTVLTLCSVITTVATDYLLFAVGRNATDCTYANNSYNNCNSTSYAWKSNPKDTGTTTTSLRIDNFGDLFHDVADGLVDVLADWCGGDDCNFGTPGFWIGCPNVNWSNWGPSGSWNSQCVWVPPVTLYSETRTEWVSGGESDNGQFNNGNTNWGSLTKTTDTGCSGNPGTDGDGDSWCWQSTPPNPGSSNKQRDDDTTNPVPIFPDPSEPTWIAVDNLGNLIGDFGDGLADPLFDAACGGYDGCSLSYTIPYINVTFTVYNENWSDITESDNSRFNGGNLKFGSLMSFGISSCSASSDPDGDSDGWCIPDPLNVGGMVDWAFDGINQTGEPSGWSDWLSQDTNFPGFYGETYWGTQPATINADIIAVGTLGQPGAPSQAVGAAPLIAPNICPAWNSNCGMFKVNNSQDGFGMGLLHINGAIDEEYGGRLTGQCVSLGNLFNLLDSTIPYLKCATTSGYFYHLNADPINTSDPALLNQMGFLGNPVVPWQQVTQGSASAPVAGQVVSAAEQNS